MLWALVQKLSGIVNEFCVGHHSLTTATLETIIKQYLHYDNDHFHVAGKNGKAPRTLSTNTDNMGGIAVKDASSTHASPGTGLLFWDLI